MAKLSRDGETWTPEEGLRKGIPTISVIDPPTYKLPQSSALTDVIVVGAGYAGLIAARDLATQGNTVLLLEARDRIGGRTWHSTINGFNYEMGGTWIHWHMPHIYREVSLYGLHDDWIYTGTSGGKHDYATLGSRGNKRNVSHVEEAAIFSKVWGLFCDHEHQFPQNTMPFPFNSMRNRKGIVEIDRMSCQDRLDQIQTSLTIEEFDILKAILLQMGGGNFEEMGYLDAIRWYALGNFTPTGLNDIGLYIRLGSGQSELARRIFQHTVDTAKLSYSFSTPVARIEQENGTVSVTSRSGKTWRARRVVCTVPLNVLADIQFQPPLRSMKLQAASIGHSHRGNKIHADLKGSDLISWASFAYPGKGMICGLADGLTPSGDTHTVAFGPSKHNPHGLSLAGPVEKVAESITHLLPIPSEITRLTYHDWTNDEFAKGTWCYYKPGFATKYLDALQRPHGNIHFANADWSDGWRGWIDGAVQQGTEVAKKLCQELSTSKASSL